jgi:hypothetical protein
MQCWKGTEDREHYKLQNSHESDLENKTIHKNMHKLNLDISDSKLGMA